MSDTFYTRLDFYRLLEAGFTDVQKATEALGIHRGTLWRWKKAYDPGRGPFGIAGDANRGNSTDKNVCPPVKQGSREEIITAMRQVALEGNVPAAKLLLSEYQNQPADEGDVLTVEGAVQLLEKWSVARPSVAEEKDHG